MPDMNNSINISTFFNPPFKHYPYYIMGITLPNYKFWVHIHFY